MEEFNALKADGAAALKGGDLSAAIAKYCAALELALDTESAGAVHSNLSLCHLKAGDLGKAREAADNCIAARPSWEKGHFRKGEVSFEEKKYEEAAACYTEALKCNPEDGTIESRKKLAEEAVNGFYFRQLLPGRDICVDMTNPIEMQIFMAAKQMQNFIYLVGDARTRECVVIDACWDTRGINKVVSSDKMKLVDAIATHFHFDHTGGMPPPPFNQMGITVPGIKEMEQQGLKCHCHEEDAPMIEKNNNVAKSNMVTYKDGDTFRVGAIEMKFIHTPGHTHGSMVIAVDGAQQGKPGGGAGILISGDTIFPGSCGRLDLPESSAERMFDSLRKCSQLPPPMIVYPGHNYNGSSSTIEREKQSGLLRDITKTQWMAMHGGRT